LEEGNLITIGQKSISKEKEFVSIDSKINQSFFKHNLPIGIDFGKSLKPNNFLTSLEILDRTLQIPKISEKIRFKLEKLRLFLTTGKIWHYKQELKSFLKKEEKQQEKNSKKDKSTKKISDNHFTSLLISLHIILNQTSTTNIKWVSQNQILKYVDSEDQKNILREWKTKNYGKLPEDTVFLSLISQTIIHQILLLKLTENQNSKLNNLINLAYSAKFSKILEIVTGKLKIISPFYLSSLNLANESVNKEKTPQTHSDINNFIIYQILGTLNILQEE
jgi:hypothetical protein